MLSPTNPSVRPAGARLLAWAAALTCGGCGGGTGDVSGKVIYQSRPLVYGTVMIVGSDGLPRYGEIKEGTFAVKGVPSGHVRIAVNSPDPLTPLITKDDSKGPRMPPPEELKRLAALKTKWFPLPKQYGDPTTSNLTLEVRKGENTYDIDLK